MLTLPWEHIGLPQEHDTTGRVRESSTGSFLHVRNTQLRVAISLSSTCERQQGPIA